MHMVGQMFTAIWHAEKIVTVKTAIPEDGADERRNASEY